MTPQILKAAFRSGRLVLLTLPMVTLLAFANKAAAPSEAVAQRPPQPTAAPQPQLPPAVPPCSMPGPFDGSTPEPPKPLVRNGRPQHPFDRVCDARSFLVPTSRTKPVSVSRRPGAITVQQGGQRNVGVAEFEPNVFGIAASRQVTNLSMQPDDLYSYHTMHIGCCWWQPGGDWLEIGWYQRYDSVWRIFTEYRLSQEGTPLTR